MDKVKVTIGVVSKGEQSACSHTSTHFVGENESFSGLCGIGIIDSLSANMFLDSAKVLCSAIDSFYACDRNADEEKWDYFLKELLKTNAGKWLVRNGLNVAD